MKEFVKVLMGTVFVLSLVVFGSCGGGTDGQQVGEGFLRESNDAPDDELFFNDLSLSEFQSRYNSIEDFCEDILFQEAELPAGTNPPEYAAPGGTVWDCTGSGSVYDFESGETLIYSLSSTEVLLPNGRARSITIVESGSIGDLCLDLSGEQTITGSWVVRGNLIYIKADLTPGIMLISRIASEFDGTSYTLESVGTVFADGSLIRDSTLRSSSRSICVPE